MLDPIDQGVESCVAGLDAVFERSHCVVMLAFESRGQAIILAQVQVDDAQRPWTILPIPRRGSLDESCREITGLGEQEAADLHHMRARGDVEQVILTLGVEGVAGREVVELCEDLVEIPSVAEREIVLHDLRFR